ncbi:MAG: hypothetical protein PHF86_03750 [Candidatus Nanoarchaeia archaeon]|nr:hypothetical protein [Candidatus Nanoarchaeia archaeon]
MANLIMDLNKEGIKSTLLQLPFDQGKQLLEMYGFRITSLEDMAKLRIEEGLNSKISQFGNLVTEGCLYLPDGIFITKNSPIMLAPIKATNHFRKNPSSQVQGTNFEMIREKKYYLSERDVEFALINSIKLPDNNISIPVNTFNDCNITRFIFGPYAKDYGKFLEKAGIDKMSIYTAGLEKEPFVVQMWFSGVNNNSRAKSSIHGINNDLSICNTLRGISSLYY